MRLHSMDAHISTIRSFLASSIFSGRNLQKSYLPYGPASLSGGHPLVETPHGGFLPQNVETPHLIANSMLGDFHFLRQKSPMGWFSLGGFYRTNLLVHTVFIRQSSTTKNHFQVMERKITVAFFAIVEVWKKTIRKTSNFGHFYRIDLPEQVIGSLRLEFQVISKTRSVRY